MPVKSSKVNPSIHTQDDGERSRTIKTQKSTPVRSGSKVETVKKSTAARLSSTAKKVAVRSRKSDNLSVPVYSLAGNSSGILALPKEIFGVKVNKKLLSQAMRVYLTNNKSLSGFTKTRGEVEGSTVKIYRQKGTGRARHGAIRAPIFVGGGITFGPKPRIVRLNLPQKMKKAALLSALSAKAADKQLIGLSGIEKASGKTKEMAKLMSSVVSRSPREAGQPSDEKQRKISALIVTSEKQDNVIRAVRNIPEVSVLPANLINAYEVLRHELLIVTKEAIEKLSGKGLNH